MSEKRIKARKLSLDEEKLVNLVDEHADELIDLVKTLISIDSRTYNPDRFSNLKAIFDYVENFMKKSGANIQYYNCPHSRGENKWPNLIASFQGSAPGKKLQFNGHLDVVPFEKEQWRDGLHPLEPVVKDGRIYGRGAVDMKGGIASQMLAAKILSEFGPEIKGTLQLWFVPDEEINGYYGSQFMSKMHKDIVDADGTIIAEPTGQPPIKSPAIIVGEKGHKWLRLRFHGSAGHGSMPKPRSNPIQKAVKFISNSRKIKFRKVHAPLSFIYMIKSLFSRFSLKNLIKAMKYSESEPDPYDEDGINIGAFFGTTISFTKINAGTKVNVIPSSCDMEVDIRVLPGITTQDIFDNLVEYCTKLGFRAKIPEGYDNIQDKNRKIQQRPIDVEFSIISCTNGTFVDPDNDFTRMLAEAFEDIYHVKAIYFFAPGSTDAVHMREQGIKNVVVFGPTGANAHDANEHVEIEHLLKTCKVYLLAAYRMLCK
ncbi:MAG: M20 family metallopeptidase [Promethearchaeota archaeon]